jgi:hypothetical protein
MKTNKDRNAEESQQMKIFLQIAQCITMLNHFFKNDPNKVFAWMVTRNPNLGEVTH